MKAVMLRETGRLEIVERPEPVPGPGQVVVRVRAASLNYRDLLTVKGGYGSMVKPPFVPLSDGAGEIAAIGPGVTRVRVGDRVMGNFFQTWLSGAAHRQRPRNAAGMGSLGGPLDGALQQMMLLSEDGVVKLADHLSFEEGAALPCAGLTAWSAVVTQSVAEPGDTVLTQGTGGVSLFALLFSKARGCRVIATSSSPEKIARLRAAGADATIDYRAEPDWGRAARALNGGEGVDQVVEVGGAGTLAQSVKAVRFGGTISTIGVLDGAKGEVNVALLVMNNIRLQGVTVGSRDEAEQMMRAVTLHRIVPPVDRVFDFEDHAAAMQWMAAGRHFGKVCIRIP